MIQLTTIRGMYIPSEAFSEGRYASKRSCIIVTNEATITMNAGILTLSGITFLSTEIKRLLSARTAAVVSPIPRPFMADVVTASVGHIPRVRTNVGFSLIMPL